MNDKPITREQQYFELFDKCPDKALQIAVENRRFEIELYWKRATYFWTLLAAVFVGFFAMQSSDSDRGGGLKGVRYLFRHLLLRNVVAEL